MHFKAVHLFLICHKKDLSVNCFKCRWTAPGLGCTLSTVVGNAVIKVYHGCQAGPKVGQINNKWENLDLLRSRLIILTYRAKMFCQFILRSPRFFGVFFLYYFFFFAIWFFFFNFASVTLIWFNMMTTWHTCHLLVLLCK